MYLQDQDEYDREAFKEALHETRQIIASLKIALLVNAHGPQREISSEELRRAEKLAELFETELKALPVPASESVFVPTVLVDDEP